MPYYTKKGVGSDKDKVCVYKKSNKEKVGCTSGSINKYLAALYANENLKESEFSWIDDIKPEFNATMLRYGQKFKNKWGEYIRTIMFIGQDDEIISYEKPMTGLIFKIIDDPSGYKPYPSYPKDHPSNSELYLNPLDFDNGLKSGQFIPMFDDSEFKLKESNGDDMDWIRDIDADELDLNDIDFITDDQMFDVLEQQGFDVSGMSIGTMCELAMNIGYRWSDKHNGWYHRDEVEDFNYLDESTVGDLEWMKGSVQIRFGDIKNNISDYLAEGDKIYLSGFLYLSGGNNNLESPIILNNEPAIIKDFTSSESHPKINVSFGENITSLPLWMNNMGGDYVDLGAFKSDDDILITVPQKNNINESEEDEFDWVKEIPIGITKDIFIDLINSHPWFYITETDDGYLSVEVTDFFEDTIGNMVGVGVMSIDFDKRQEHILNQIRKEFNWSYDLALNHQGPDKIKYLVIANDELAKILEPYVGKDNVKYYGGLVESKNFISESSGISLEVRDWSEIIYKEILESGSGERIIIDGYKYPKVFDVFPIDYIVIDFYDKLTGYDQDYSGYDSDGNYVVRLFIQPMVVNGNNKYSLLTVLNHEMKHAWQDYNRLSKGFSSIEHTKESKELYNKDFIIMLSNNNIKGPIKELLKYYYYVSNIEKEAYLENVYDGNVEYEKIVRDLISLDIESFKDRFDLDVNWFTINTNYNIPFLKKFKTPIEFIDYSSKHLKTRALDIIKKINKMKYVHKIK